MHRKLLYLLIVVIYCIPSVLNSQSFSRIDPGFPVCQEPAAEWVDVDNDGDLDVFFTGLDETSSPEASLYLNDNGTFTFQSSGIDGVYLAACDVGDFNNDGLADLVVSGTNGTTSTTIIYSSNGDGTSIMIGYNPFARSSVFRSPGYLSKSIKKLMFGFAPP